LLPYNNAGMASVLCNFILVFLSNESTSKRTDIDYVYFFFKHVLYFVHDVSFVFQLKRNYRILAIRL
jgi:hypothetical protein